MNCVRARMAAPLACLVFYLAIIGVESATPNPSDQEAACSSLQQIADRSSICTTTSTCTQLRCDALGTTTNITVLPCATRPSVSIVTMQDGRVIYSHVFSQSEIVPITTPSGIPILRLNVSLAVSPDQDSMVLEVNAIPILGQPISIIPRTTIPLSRSQCNFVATSSSSSYTADTAPTSAPSVRHAQTCQALQGIARGSAGQCSTMSSCTALDCNFLGQYHVMLTIEPCNNPPAVGVVIEDASGDVIVNETLVDSRTQPIEWQGIHLFDLIINIRHMQNPDSIVLKVSIHSATLGRDIVVVPDTPIPINRCSCPGVVCATTDSPPGGMVPTAGGTNRSSDGTRFVIYTNPTAGSSKQQSLLVKIVVPLAVLALLAVAIVVILVIVGVVYAKRKRASAYNFQRVAFSNGNDEEEEEGLVDAI